MALSGWKLIFYARVLPKSPFITILFRDGLIYYAFVLVLLPAILNILLTITSLSLFGNIVIMVFEILNIDPIFNIMFNPSSICILTVS